jgi:hypothetical protein
LELKELFPSKYSQSISNCLDYTIIYIAIKRSNNDKTWAKSLRLTSRLVEIASISQSSNIYSTLSTSDYIQTQLLHIDVLAIISPDVAVQMLNSLEKTCKYLFLFYIL